MIWFILVVVLLLIYMGGKKMGYPKDRLVGIDEINRPAKKSTAKKSTKKKK